MSPKHETRSSMLTPVWTYRKITDTEGLFDKPISFEKEPTTHLTRANNPRVIKPMHTHQVRRSCLSESWSCTAPQKKRYVRFRNGGHPFRSSFHPPSRLKFVLLCQVGRTVSQNGNLPIFFPPPQPADVGLKLWLPTPRQNRPGGPELEPESLGFRSGLKLVPSWVPHTPWNGDCVVVSRDRGFVVDFFRVRQ